ncbi:MAG: PDZ domain-containing protein [Caldilineaceae bacterium]
MARRRAAHQCDALRRLSADEAASKRGDIIMAVDGEDTTAMELSDVVDRIRAPRTPRSRLAVLRLDEAKNESLDIVITRQEIEVPPPTGPWSRAPTWPTCA